MGHVGYALCPHPVLMTRGPEREPDPLAALRPYILEFSGGV
jgi:hypothetical protein